MKTLSLVLLSMSVLLLSCEKDSNNPQGSAAIAFKFDHILDGSAVTFDQLIYQNAAGNDYEVTEVQWFVSDIQLNGEDGSTSITQDDNIHYIDTNIPGTETWLVTEGIPRTIYSSLTLTFGIKGDKNTVGRFPDLPESNMIWPYHMGGDNGGYHYMKLNGFWLDTLAIRQPFNFHLGVGPVQEEDGTTTYHQNWFELTIPVNIDARSKDEIVMVPVLMNIENWFENPNTWNWDEIGPKIMKNQSAMAMGIANGETDVLEVGQVQYVTEL